VLYNCFCIVIDQINNKILIKSYIKFFFLLLLFHHFSFSRNQKKRESLMTIQVAHSRSKRRKLPRRNIVDYEYVAPLKSTDLEQNLGLLQSARLRSVISEVWGDEVTQPHRTSQPIVIDQQHSSLTKKRAMSGTKSLLEKLKEHEEQMALDLSNVVIIPPAQNKKQHTSPLASIDTNTTVNNIEQQLQQEALEKSALKQNTYTLKSKDMSVHHLDNSHAPEQDVGTVMDTCTNTLANATQHDGVTTYWNRAGEILLSEGLDYDQLPHKHLSSKQDDAYLSADKGSSGTDNAKEVVEEKEAVQHKKEHEKRENTETFIDESPNDAEFVISDDTLSQSNTDLQQETFLPSQGVLQKWSLAQKNKTKHSMLEMLKKSSALDWVVDGPDLDARKDHVGMIRKQQLQNKLNKPFLERKKIQKNASNWLVSRKH
jgi:hypothetical protein